MSTEQQLSHMTETLERLVVKVEHVSTVAELTRDDIAEIKNDRTMTKERTNTRLSALEQGQQRQAGFLSGVAAAGALMFGAIGTVLVMAYNELSGGIKALAQMIFHGGGQP